MGPRSSGFNEMEGGYPAIPDSFGPQEPAEPDQEKEEVDEEDMDELDIAEAEYLREIHSGMLMDSDD